MNFKIKEMPENERPRERLINKGAFSLSDAELLAIILKSGTREMSAHTLAIYLLKKYKNLRYLKNITYKELVGIKGIGQAKACQVMALFELARRINNKQEKILDVKITSPSIVFEYYKNIVDCFQEGFYCLYLDSAKRVLKEKKIFVGTVNQSMVHPRDIFKEAYRQNATAFICIHNHPNGDITPSRQDIETTNRLKEIGYLMGIKLVDHVIIGDDKYYSFLENGKI